MDVLCSTVMHRAWPRDRCAHVECARKDGSELSSGRRISKQAVLCSHGHLEEQTAGIYDKRNIKLRFELEISASR